MKRIQKNTMKHVSQVYWSCYISLSDESFGKRASSAVCMLAHNYRRLAFMKYNLF